MLNRFIDHTLLKPQATDMGFEKLLTEAVKYNFKSVCVSPYIAVPVANALKSYPEINSCTVVGFPFGNLPLIFKLQQVEYFIRSGVQEIDWVIHYGEALNKRWSTVSMEAGQIAALCRQAGVVSKCIVETSVLDTETLQTEIFKVVQDAGVDFIKTSTGYVGEGAKVETVTLWKKLRGNNDYPKIKASAGIKTLDQALDLIGAGADRLGMSASVEVMEEYLKRNSFKINEEDFK